MPNLPLVSIVTPAYNQAEYLADTIESVLAQDYPNLEYIVLDDGSTDNTPEVLQRYDGRIRHERHANMGQANTLNRGWSMASGSLIGYLSSDDLLKPHAISMMVKTLISQPVSSAAYCDYNLIDAQGRRFRTVRTEDYNAERLSVGLVCQPGPGALFRREIFDQTGGWAGHLRQIPDFEFWLRASKFGPFIRVPEILADYRIHDGSASFRPIPAERSMEIVAVMSEYWNSRADPQAKRALAMAYIIAAKSHLQSGRILACLSQCRAALKSYPPMFVSGLAWRMIASGTLRRLIYRLRQRDR